MGENYTYDRGKITSAQAGTSKLDTLPQSESDKLLARLMQVKNRLQDVCDIARETRAKIVGTAPEEVVGNNPTPATDCFLAAIDQGVSELELLVAQTHEVISRINRVF